MYCCEVPPTELVSIAARALTLSQSDAKKVADAAVCEENPMVKMVIEKGITEEVMQQLREMKRWPLRQRPQENFAGFATAWAG